MTTPTPSPRPAALVIAQAVDRLVAENPEGIAAEVLAALSGHGYCLIPRAELEEAAEAAGRSALDHIADSGTRRWLEDLAKRLRERSRG